MGYRGKDEYNQRRCSYWEKYELEWIAPEIKIVMLTRLRASPRHGGATLFYSSLNQNGPILFSWFYTGGLVKPI
jgi:hypothetical protein